MSSWIRKTLFSNLSLKVVSLVLAVAIYVLVRPTTGRHTRHDGRPAAAAWKPDAGAPGRDGSPGLDAGRDGTVRREAAAVPTVPARRAAPTSAPASRDAP
jgi:hypothetical protein